MTVWIYGVDFGEFEELAVVEDGSVVEGDESVVLEAFPDGIPMDEIEVAREFDGVPLFATTDFDMDWSEDEEQVREELEARELEDSDLSLEEYEAYLDSVWSGMVCGEDTTRTLVEFAESELPQTIKNNLETAIWSTDAVFSQFDTLADNDIVQLREFLSEELTAGGWTIDSLAGRLQDLHGELDESEAERIARTETNSIVNKSYEVGLEERGVDLDKAQFYWVSEPDNRRTLTCEWLTEQTNPNAGGSPVSLERLKELIQEAPDHDPDIETEPREFTPHINCRSRYVRHID